MNRNEKDEIVLHSGEELLVISGGPSRKFTVANHDERISQVFGKVKDDEHLLRKDVHSF